MPKLTITLVDGKNLVAKDFGGTSDPYCIFKISTYASYKSKTVKKTLNPVWNETFSMTVNNPNTDEYVVVIFLLTCKVWPCMFMIGIGRSRISKNVLIFY